MRRVGVLAGIIAALALAGCGSSTDRPLRATLAALEITPAHVTTSRAALSKTKCGDVTASLRPPAVMPTPGAMPADSFMGRIQRRHYLIAGVDQNTLLFAYFNPRRRRLEGLEIDLVRQLAKAIFGDPSHVRFKAITPAQRLPAVENGSVDVVVDAVTITCERRKEVDFSTVYFDAGQKVLVPLSSRARSIRDLAGKRVCAAIGSTTIATLAQRRPRVVPYGVPQRTDCLVALQEGLVDGISSDDAILLGFKAQDPATKIIGGRFAPEPYGMAISKAHPDFVRFVNGVLARLRTDGTWRSIYRRWLGRLARVPSPPAPHYSG
jgi:polar amino acid transport system substrate-binding protein